MMNKALPFCNFCKTSHSLVISFFEKCKKLESDSGMKGLLLGQDRQEFWFSTCLSTSDGFSLGLPDRKKQNSAPFVKNDFLFS